MGWSVYCMYQYIDSPPYVSICFKSTYSKVFITCCALLICCVCVVAGTVPSNEVAPELTAATASGHTAKVVRSCVNKATDCEGLEDVATHSWLMEKQTLLERIKTMELERDSLLVNMMKLQDELYDSEFNRQPISSRPSF